MTSRVRIGLVRCERHDDYLAALRLAGADVVEVDPQEPVDVAALDGVLGVCLPGGPDIDPVHYGEAVHQTAVLASAARDALELQLARELVRLDVPLLAICRGLQVLNVALGGSLVQHLPEHVREGEAHSVDDTLTSIAHGVDVTPASWLGRAAVAGMATQVNSRHHQAVRTLAPDLRVTATASDGVAEGIELPDAAFCVGVQWHPENFWRTGEGHALFALFVERARRVNRPLR